MVKKVISEISVRIKAEANRKGKLIEPPMPDMFKAFNVPLDKVKAIILGQDPTPQAGKATGLAFSLKPGVDPTDVPSVENMLVELKWEGMNVGLTNGDLTPWLGQGVLLLNSALTINIGQGIGSHQALWRPFTELLVKFVSKNAQPSAWILWGNEAKKIVQLIDPKKHYIKVGAHPRAAAGFFGGNYFACTNLFLKNRAKRGEIAWKIPPRFVRKEGQCQKTSKLLLPITIRLRGVTKLKKKNEPESENSINTTVTGMHLSFHCVLIPEVHKVRFCLEC